MCHSGLASAVDGLAEHDHRGEAYVPDRLEQKLREVKHHTAKQIFDEIMTDLIAFDEPADDISMVIIKRGPG